MKINGLQETLKALDKFGELGVEAVKANVEVAGYNMQAEAMRRVPVDLGNIKGSIVIELSDNGLTVALIAGGIAAPHAPFQEFGTGGLVQVPAGMEELASAHRGFGLRQVNIRPQPFMFPAWDKERKEFVVRLNKELERLARQA